ncbi:hypothetical protein Agub_g11325 [Astrephomene gubernaculifera]|uniref:EGF-like domain-containing protein n=1 Tax=Astrephomene gubernaculifera TaxID=47775 RepID=A0AAD3DWS2_9CHLO|nr:hypothetical protein Agub_g11325 [Astrephomene gubernaculifera]
MDFATPQLFHVTLVILTSLLLAAPGGADKAWASRPLLTGQRSLVVSKAVGTLKSISPGGAGAQLDGPGSALQATSTSSGDSPRGPSKCPGECTKYGTCNEELGRCDCPLGRTGTDCSQLAPEAELLSLCARHGHTASTCGIELDLTSCLNACNYRGRCIAGFCHCSPGFFGADCALSLAPEAAGGSGSGFTAAAAVEILAGQNYTLRASGPRIYVYELPPEINIHSNLDRLDRPLMYMIWQRLLSGGLRVADPAQADFFFVPVRARLSYDSTRVAQAVSYIQSTWPYWNATGGGERHLFIHTGDWGRDELSEDVQLLTRNASWLTHWGLARNHDFAGWLQSHRPGRDIVLPMMLQASLLASYRLTKSSPLHPRGPRRTRSRTLFFAGRVCGSRVPPTTNGTFPNCPDVLAKEDSYSAATRQRAFFHHHNRTNWKVVTSTRTQVIDMLSSKFCLAPSGSGMGKRSVVSVLMGCVPVTLTDGLMQPFEPELRWDRFAIDVRERDIPIMHQILEALRADQVAEFQSNLRCAAQHLFWSSLYGSVFGEDGRYDAFETLVQVLRMRAVYPSLAPEEYGYVDPAFAAFMNCQEPPLPGDVASARAGAAAAAGASGRANARAEASGASAAAAAALDVGKPALQQVLAGSDRPAPRPRGLPQDGRQPLCSHSELSLLAGESVSSSSGADASDRRSLVAGDASGGGVEGVFSSCGRCMKRRGRLLNPGGTICCNTRDLASCPRLWD